MYELRLISYDNVKEKAIIEINKYTIPLLQDAILKALVYGDFNEADKDSVKILNEDMDFIVDYISAIL